MADNVLWADVRRSRSMGYPGRGRGLGESQGLRPAILCSFCLIGLSLAVLSAGEARAQSASLYGIPGQRAPLSLDSSSWFFQEVEPPKQIQVKDLITIVVNQASQMTSEAEVDRRKRANFDMRLQDWIFFRGSDLKPAPMSDGEPRIRGQLTSQLRSEMGLERDDSVRFRITAEVVDIRPNGNLVIEAHGKVVINNEIWEQSLSGIVRREDVLPNNTVLSEKIAQLHVEKREQGHVRDAVKRGWLLKMLDYAKPF